MKKALTVIIDSKLEKMIHDMQADMIKKSSKSMSFSKTLSILIEEGLKNRRELIARNSKKTK